jgi:hypothetical protein
LRQRRGAPGGIGTPLVLPAAGGDVPMIEILGRDPDDPFMEDAGWK